MNWDYQFLINLGIHPLRMTLMMYAKGNIFKSGIRDNISREYWMVQ